MHIRRLTLILLLPLTLALAAGVAGADPSPAEGDARPADDSGASTFAPEGAPLIHGRLALTLADALKMGLQNNLDVQVERYAPVIADHDVSIAEGAFDPEAFAEFGYSDNRTPSGNLLAGRTTTSNRFTDGFGGLRGQLPLAGTEYSAQFEGGRASTNIPFQTLSPELTSAWSLSLVQPLLKDLIWNQPWTQVRTSRILMESSGENFRRAVMDTVSSIEGAYWALIASADAMRVAQKSLETAAALLDQTETQFEVGVVSKVEVTEAQAGLSQREVNLIVNTNAYRNQQDVLIDLVMGPGLKSSSTLEIEPTDQPEEYIPYVIDVETAVERAFEARPELATARKEVERQKIQLRFAKNQRLPELDAILSFGQKGLSGDQSSRFDPCRLSNDPACDPGDFPDLGQGNWDKAFDDYDDSPQFTARGRFSVPLPNTSARHAVSKTELELRRARTQKKRLEQTIILEVRKAARNLEASQEAIDAARDAERAAQEQLRAERIRLEYGESTPFDVLQREEDLVDRENELIGAFQAYRTSVTALDRAQGTILRNRNIKIAEVSTLR